MYALSIDKITCNELCLRGFTRILVVALARHEKLSFMDFLGENCFQVTNYPIYSIQFVRQVNILNCPIQNFTCQT